MPIKDNIKDKVIEYFLDRVEVLEEYIKENENIINKLRSELDKLRMEKQSIIDAQQELIRKIKISRWCGDNGE